ncbi:MAG: AMP-binding protein [Pseudonocardiaceae bacterium]|nr:AMP-binding protein [Pseudonocardiaceae bacterium]
MEHTEQTIPALLQRNASEFGDLPAITSLDDPEAGTLSWAEFRGEIAVLARGLAHFGLRPRDRMLIQASSRPEHWIADLAAVHISAIPSTVYATLSPEQIEYVARHSSARIVVLEGAEQLERWRAVLDELPELAHVVLLDPAAVPENDSRFVSWAALRANGAELHEADPEAFERGLANIRPDDPIAMIYTSGTTGPPKGVVLSHRNVVHEADAVETMHETPMHPSNIAYLPLAHIAERELSIYIPIFKAGHVHTLADPTAVVGALGKVHPTGFFGVPRVWEKVATGLRGMVAGAPEERKEALSAATELVREGYRLRNEGKEVPDDLAARIAEADRTVIGGIRQLLGLDNVRTAVSGAAALPVDVLHFLAGFGIEIMEVWGLSETTGAATANTARSFRAGTVGRPVPGVQVRTGDDGELFVRGPIVFPGYLAEDGSIRSATDADGWLPTGDIGTIDEDGFVTITDRKKELIITSGGKNIAPTQVEGLIRQHPLVGQVAAIGNGRPYLSALITLDEEAVPAWASANGIEQSDPAALASHPRVLEALDDAVAAANERLARAEQIKRYRVLPATWTPESGEVTPTLKLKRAVIGERYRAEIETLYQTGEAR